MLIFLYLYMLIFEYLYIRIYLYKIFLYKLPIRILYKKTLYKFILQLAHIAKPEPDILVSLVSDILPGSIPPQLVIGGKKPAL